MKDLTIIYLTANKLPRKFHEKMYFYFRAAALSNPFVIVAKQPVQTKDAWKSLSFDTPRSHINIYREALAGVKLAETKYIAIAEDDVLYSPQHFDKRPTKAGVFAYNTACWSIYTWSIPPIFSYTGRRNHGMLICERDLYIKAFEERFAKFSDDSQIDNAIWAEPGKYESQLGVTVQQTETFYTDPANIMFTHPDGLSHNTLGFKKRLAPIRAFEIPYWGRAEEVMQLYQP